jgi:hypothetical protein
MPTRFGWMADTDPKALQALIEIERKKTAGEKLVQVFEMADMMLRGFEDRVRREYPQAGEREVFLRAAALRLGNETVRRVYGWDPQSGIAP